MLNDFVYHNPTKIYFGKRALDNLSAELGNYGNSILLLYGKGAIKKTGLYDKIIAVLNECGKSVVELSGVKPNPSYSQVKAGAALVRENCVDLILAVGGGSVIDCAKAISASAYAEGDAWDRYWIKREAVNNKVIPIGAILTMAATASEMNSTSVITNEEVMLKVGRTFTSDLNPRFSILNPELTYTVPKIQMVSGIFDILSHLMEQYFSGEDDNTSDYLIEGIMKSLIKSARVALEKPDDYEARSNIMWCATLGLNRLAGVSKKQDWQVHHIEHQLGAYTDCPHGLGLAVISMPYYRYIYRYGIDRFVRFAETVWGIDPSGKSKDYVALEGIAALESFAIEMGIPLTLRELGATEDMLPLIAESTEEGGGYKYMTAEDTLAVLKACY